MKTRDVATIAFRVLALWVVISAITGLMDLLLNWDAVAAQVMSGFKDVSNPPTRQGLLWLSASAFVGRGLVGLIAWWLSPLLARLTCPREDGLVATERGRDLYAAASFLVGLWLIAGSGPGLAFAAYAATRPGFPAYPETQPQVPLLLPQFLLGLSLLRGQWLIGLVTGGTEPRGKAEAEGAVQQGDAADERR